MDSRLSQVWSKEELHVVLGLCHCIAWKAVASWCFRIHHPPSSSLSCKLSILHIPTNWLETCNSWGDMEEEETRKIRPIRAIYTVLCIGCQKRVSNSCWVCVSLEGFSNKYFVFTSILQWLQQILALLKNSNFFREKSMQLYNTFKNKNGFWTYSHRV